MKHGALCHCQGCILGDKLMQGRLQAALAMAESVTQLRQQLARNPDDENIRSELNRASTLLNYHIK